VKNFGVFRVKNHDFTPKNHIFSNFRGGVCRVRPPGSTPEVYYCNITIATVAFNCKKNLKVPKGQSETTNLRTENTMVKRKEQNDKQ
jgi:hypothetical protein